MKPGTIDAPAKQCRACGVEVAVSVMAQHKKSVACVARKLAIKTTSRGLVRCEDAIFEYLTKAGAHVEKLATGIEAMECRTMSSRCAVKEQWADKTAVELMRQPEWSLEMRLKAVELYVAWRKENPSEPVSYATDSIHTNPRYSESWYARGSVGIGFSAKRGLSREGSVRMSVGQYVEVGR